MSFVLGACAGPGGVAPSPTVELDAILSVTRSAISIYYEESVLPAGSEPGGLSAAEHQVLRDRIVADFEKYYTGAALRARLTDTLQWADSIATSACLRTTVARIESFEGQVVASSADTTIVSGAYVVYHVNAAGAGRGLTTWGGTLTMSYVANVDRVGGRWLVSALSQQQEAFVADPNVRLTAPPPPQSAAPSSPISATPEP